MSKTVSVDKKTCLGCGTCVVLAPKTFKMGEDDKAEPINPPADEEGKIQEAIDACPVTAIKWGQTE